MKALHVFEDPNLLFFKWHVHHRWSSNSKLASNSVQGSAWQTYIAYCRFQDRHFLCSSSGVGIIQGIEENKGGLLPVAGTEGTETEKTTSLI